MRLFETEVNNILLERLTATYCLLSAAGLLAMFHNTDAAATVTGSFRKLSVSSGNKSTQKKHLNKQELCVSTRRARLLVTLNKLSVSSTPRGVLETLK
jgi:hypothetical protein